MLEYFSQPHLRHFYTEALRFLPNAKWYFTEVKYSTAPNVHYSSTQEVLHSLCQGKFQAVILDDGSVHVCYGDDEWMMFLHPSGLSAVALRIQRGLLEVEYTERRFVMYPYGIERGEVGQPGTRGPVGAPGYDY